MSATTIILPMRGEQARLESGLRQAGEQLARQLRTVRADPVEGRVLLARLIRAVPYPVLVTDSRRRYIDANGRATRLLGYTRGQLLSLHVPDVVASDIGSSLERWNRFTRWGIQEGEVALRRRDDSIVVVSYWARTDVLPDVHVSILSQSVGTIDEVRPLGRRPASRRRRPLPPAAHRGRR